MIALCLRLLMTTLICCGVITTGAVAVGHRRMGISVAYQIDGHPCTTHFVDTDRPTESHALVNKPSFCLRHNAWSPNHRYAALTPYPHGLLSIAVGRSGREWRRTYDVAGVIAIQTSLVWSPDSTQLAFLTDNKEVTVIGTIRLVNDLPDQPRFFTIASTQPVLASLLAWSSDGQSLAFGAYPAPRQLGGEELYVLNLNKGDVRRLTTNTYRDESPSWSPDGTEIVFASAATGYNELYVMNVATRERRRITTSTMGYTPSWAPNRNWIAFQSDLDYAYDLYVISSTGFGLRRLTFNHSVSRIIPIWLR